MKRILMRYTLISVVLIASLLGFGCDQGTQNTNVPQNTNSIANANTAKAVPETEALGDTCEGSLDEKLDKLQKKLDKRFKDDKDIGAQLGQGHFKFKVDKGSGIYATRLVLYVEGVIIGNDHFPDLLKIVKDYMKKGCLEKVRFVPEGTIPASGTLTPPPDGDGFDWIACESPMVPCTDGRCDMPASCGTITANTNTKGNENTIGNSNPITSRSP
jgi:hypothetical protein